MKRMFEQAIMAFIAVIVIFAVIDSATELIRPYMGYILGVLGFALVAVVVVYIIRYGINRYDKS